MVYYGSKLWALCKQEQRLHTKAVMHHRNENAKIESKKYKERQN